MQAWHPFLHPRSIIGLLRSCPDLRSFIWPAYTYAYATDTVTDTESKNTNDNGVVDIKGGRPVSPSQSRRSLVPVTPAWCAYITNQWKRAQQERERIRACTHGQQHKIRGGGGYGENSSSAGSNGGKPPSSFSSSLSSRRYRCCLHQIQHVRCVSPILRPRPRLRPRKSSAATAAAARRHHTRRKLSATECGAISVRVVPVPYAGSLRWASVADMQVFDYGYSRYLACTH